MTVTELSFRDGGPSDLPATFALTRRSIRHAAKRQGVMPAGAELPESQIEAEWAQQRSFVEFLAAQAGGCYVIAEADDGGLCGYARTVRLGEMEQMTELAVAPEQQGAGLGRDLLGRCWPGAPTPELGRIVVATGAPTDLTLYTNFGVMPVAGHWHLRQRTETYQEQDRKSTRL